MLPVLNPGESFYAYVPNHMRFYFSGEHHVVFSGEINYRMAKIPPPKTQSQIESMVKLSLEPTTWDEAMDSSMTTFIRKKI